MAINQIILQDSGHFKLFENPIKIITCSKLDEVEDCLNQLENEINKGNYAAGFISYEAGYAFEEKLKNSKNYDFPLIWFGIYKKPKHIKTLPNKQCKYNVNNLSFNINENEYLKNIDKIKKLIEKGDTYQVNYTLKYKFDLSGSALDLYKSLIDNHPVPYSAYIENQGFKILSLSPELFFEKEGRKIIVKPMKGTIKRGRTLDEDSKNKSFLENDPKNQSENLMIVDLLRNDLGKVSKTCSVKTKRLFEVDKYKSLFQMTSTIESKLSDNLSIRELFKALFPSGSVTGAPKIRTMEIINELEKEARKIYTGSIGYISPDGTAKFNVAIRTILVQNNKAEMGIGSGIVYDSDPKKEYEECKLKANFLTSPHQEFKLIETILWKPKQGYFLKDLHLKRLKASAEYFSFRYEKASINNRLETEAKKFDKNKKYRVRFLLNKDGKIEITSQPLKKAPKKITMAISDKKTNSSDPFLFHKTTNRIFYDSEHKKYAKKGYFDVIFTNEKGEITEGAISNIIIKKNGKYYTPPLECGLLDGVYRKYFIKKEKVIEKVLYIKDLKIADEILLMNSVRGLVKVKP